MLITCVSKFVLISSHMQDTRHRKSPVLREPGGVSKVVAYFWGRVEGRYTKLTRVKY